MVQADGRVVRDEQAAVKGQFPDQESRCEAVTVQQPVQSHNACGQAGDLQQGACQLGEESIVFLFPDLLLGGDHPVPYVKDRICQVKLDPRRHFVALIVLGILQDHIGNGAVVPGIVLFVENIPVQFRQLADRPDISGGDDLHKGDLFTLPVLLGDIPGRLFIVHFVLQEHLRVAAHGHQVRSNLHNGVYVPQAFSIRSETKHTDALPLYIKTGQ